jgi:predicted dehydrogenase
MRIAVLGCGSIGQRHLRNLRSLGETNVIVYDPLPSALAAAAGLGFQCAGTPGEVWSFEPELALIASPPGTHAPLALEAAKNGAALFIEKPLAVSLSELDGLMALARRNNLVTMVGCNMRFHPGPAAVKRLLDAGAIGRALSARIQAGSYLPEWRPDTDYRHAYSALEQPGVGAVLECIHEIDLALWYFGPGATHSGLAVRAASLGIDAEGLAEMLIVHETGTVSSVHLNFIQRDYRRCCQIIGERGTIYWDFERPAVEIRSSYTDSRTYELPAPWDVNQMYIDELRYLLDHVATKTPTFCDLEAGRRALNLALEIIETPVNKS